MDDVQAQKVRELEASKARMISTYLELQDQADELNGRIYNLCCEIEIVNQQIAQIRKAAPGPATPVRPMTSPPPPGPAQIPPIA